MTLKANKEKRMTIINNALAVCMILLNLVVGLIVDVPVIALFPTLVSPIIYLLNSRANKWTYMIGGVNSAIYSIGYFIEGVYALALNALLISCPVQIYTFFTWKKHAYKEATKFKVMDWWQRVLLCIGTVVGIVVTYIILINVEGSSQQILDAITFVVGTVAAFTVAFAYMETIVYNLLNATMTFILWLVPCISGNLSNIPYLIISIFSLYCQILASIKWVQLYKEQKYEQRRKGEGGGADSM